MINIIINRFPAAVARCDGAHDRGKAVDASALGKVNLWVHLNPANWMDADENRVSLSIRRQ